MHSRLAPLTYRAIQSLRHEPVFTCLRELEDSQWYSADRLRELQWSRLTRLLAHSYDTVPFYRQRFARLGLVPQDIRSPEDFARLPVLTKAELRSERSALLSTAALEKTSAVATSGSSGDPLTVVRDRTSTAYHRAAKYRGHHWFGIDIGAREARLWGVPVDFSTRLRERVKDYVMNRIRASAYELDRESMFRFFRQVSRCKPDYLFGYASLVYEFARFILDESLDGKSLKVKAAVTTSETLHDFQREVIEAAFGCPAVNEFGCTETGIIAFQCPHKGMHIPVETVFVEIETDEQVGASGLGRVILTDLHNRAMPIIRYDIGDVAALSDEECSCGRRLPLLKDIAGRACDTIVTPDGRRIHSIIFYYILCGLESKGGGIKKFQMVREAPDSYTLTLVRDTNFRDEDFSLAKNKIAEYLGNRVDVRYQFVDAIDRTAAGKHRDFIDLAVSDAAGG